MKILNVVKWVAFAGFCVALSIVIMSAPQAGNIKYEPDADNDGYATEKCEISDSGKHDCEALEHADNCPNVFNPLQIGLACDYDLNRDGFVTIDDYSLVVSLANYSQRWYSFFGELPLFVDEGGVPNTLGDMDEDGYITYVDQCDFIVRAGLTIILPWYSICWIL